MTWKKFDPKNLPDGKVLAKKQPRWYVNWAY